MTNVLVLAPHIDDEVLGCGGSMIKHISLGNKVHVAYMSSSVLVGECFREKEAEAACCAIGVQSYRFLRADPDKLGDEAIRNVVDMIRANRVDILYSPHLDDGDAHHIKTSELASRVRWLAGSNSYKTSAEPYSVSGLFLYEVHRPIREVHYLEDITLEHDKKRSVLELYKTQISEWPIHEAILGLNRYRGVMSGTSTYAEAFQVSHLKNLISSRGDL